jgi:hypothetical protein
VHRCREDMVRYNAFGHCRGGHGPGRPFAPTRGRKPNKDSNQCMVNFSESVEKTTLREVAWMVDASSSNGRGVGCTNVTAS